MPIGEGHSNVTFGLSTGVVLRRPPRGPLPPSAHDVLREARLLRALAATPVRSPEVLAVCDDPSRDRRAVLRDGADRRRGDHRLGARPARQPGAARSDRRRADRRAGRAARRRLDRGSAWRGSASRPATSSASCADSTGCGSTTGRASCRRSRRSARGLRANMPESPPATIVHGDYRLGNTMFAAERPGAADRDLRLGDGDDRRPARRRRLHADALDRARRPPGQVQPEQRDAAARVSHARASWSRATSSGRAARCRRSTGTSRSRCGRRSCSWRATTSGRIAGLHRRPVSEVVRRRRGRNRRPRAGGHAPWLLRTGATAGCWSTGAAC